MEKRAIEIIKKAGDEGVLQSDLWKMLGTDSREGSRIAIRLERKGFIEREPTVHAGKKTYRLRLIKRPPRKISIATVKGCPCFVCPDLTKCAIGHVINPVTCKKLTTWILEQISSQLEESERRGND
ncbi:MAG: Lrp/AsnC family transcriptional regulator [Candidatus Methanomethylicota archaeon]|uniref:Lrp/AsnC family transcriptional regulator n=1 Tax=Thermoproteota archaeon TaxID=2056631 RepID=A0A497EXV3_9CREN|nr:MAG: Lrp/AsnC family transcriptional regulator [Candidatus Verstraetearchaeota archaeon]RLE54332.1 MAG: Lrp/AsnC family transcriptional regulator [Candidatus Verstraetearchaeota archaeon]